MSDIMADQTSAHTQPDVFAPAGRFNLVRVATADRSPIGPMLGFGVFLWFGSVFPDLSTVGRLVVGLGLAVLIGAVVMVSMTNASDRRVGGRPAWVDEDEPVEVESEPAAVES